VDALRAGALARAWRREVAASDALAARGVLVAWLGLDSGRGG
jgi:hypothetical protein